MGGEYRAVDRPRRLAYTWEPGWDPDMQKAPSLVEITLEPAGNATHLTVVHDLDRYAEQMSGYYEGWDRVLGWLNRYVRS